MQIRRYTEKSTKAMEQRSYYANCYSSHPERRARNKRLFLRQVYSRQASNNHESDSKQDKQQREYISQ